MKRSLFVVMLAATSEFAFSENKPECGTREHCYAMLKKIRSLSAQEHEKLSELTRNKALEFTRFTLDLVNEAMKKSLHGETNSGDKEYYLNELRKGADKFVGEAYGCSKAFDWTQRMKNNPSQAFPGITDFDCTNMIAQALQDNQFQYPPVVVEWLSQYERKSTKAEPNSNHDDNAKLDSAIANLERQIRDSKTLKAKKEGLKKVKKLFVKLESENKNSLATIMELSRSIKQLLAKKKIPSLKRENVALMNKKINHVKAIVKRHEALSQEGLKEVAGCLAKKKLTDQNISKVFEKLTMVESLNKEIRAKMPEIKSFSLK